VGLIILGRGIEHESYLNSWHHASNWCQALHILMLNFKQEERKPFFDLSGIRMGVSALSMGSLDLFHESDE